MTPIEAVDLPAEYSPEEYRANWRRDIERIRAMLARSSGCAACDPPGAATTATMANEGVTWIVAALEAAEQVAARYGVLFFADDPDLSALAAAMGHDVRDVKADHCGLCLSKVYSGLGSYPWTCGNGHTLYFGAGRLSAENRRLPKVEARS